MPFSVLTAPEDEARLQALAEEFILAAQRLGMNPEPRGFLISWASGTKVLVDRDASGEIVGFLLMACGDRWLERDVAAGVMIVKGRDTEGLLEYAKNIAAAVGAKSFYVEEGEPNVLPDGSKQRTVTEYFLR